MDQRIIKIEEDNLGRIDKYLAKVLENTSRSQVQLMIDNNEVLVNNKMIKASYVLVKDDLIIINYPKLKETTIEAEDIPLDIYYEDSDLIVVNKPSGMVVHPASGNYEGTLVNALIHHCKDLSGINGVMRAGIVHRIDT
jgi:23S rRNA pseudouridine1911/1915/1917 synthase